MPVGDRAVSKKELESLARQLRNQIKAVRGHAVTWAGTFLDLVDAPDSFSGEASKIVAVATDEVTLEFITPTFLALGDTPANFTGSGNKILRVDSTPDALEFGADLNDLEDVNAGSPNDGDALVWVNASSEWQPVAGGVAHNILSASHSDAETASLVRGDLLIVDAVPELVGLAISATAGQVLRTDGVDPSWATLDMDDLANSALVDPDADRIVFWDDAPTGEYAWLTPTEGIQIATQDLKLNVSGLAEETTPASGDKFVIWDGTVHKKVDYDNMPGGNGGGGAENPWAHRRTGRCYTTWDFYTAAIFAITRDTLYAYPFIVPVTQTFDRILVAVSTAQTNGVCRLGIYNDSGVYPSALIVDSGEIDCSSTGYKSVVINEELTAGLYWLVINHDGDANVTFRAMDYNITYPMSWFAVLGKSDTNWVTPPHTHWKVSGTYGALPTPFTGGAAMQNAENLVAIHLRAA